MKNYLLVLLILLSLQIIAQNNVGIGTNIPHPSAKLDIKDSTKGILIPRMNTIQRNAIVSPANGLLVYDNDSLAFMYFNGSIWKKLNSDFIINNDWTKTGNSGTNPNINFIGTTDSNDLSFRVNGQKRMLLTTNGRLEIYGYTLDSASISIGKNAGINNTATGGNIFIGKDVAVSNSGSSNTVLGTKAANKNTSGYENVFIGHNAALNNTVGRENTFVGNLAGRSNVNGNTNTLIGNAAGVNVIDGQSNTIVGSDAGTSITSGDQNVIIGASAANSSKSSQNVFIGNHTALASVNGGLNTFVGNLTGLTNKNGSNNTLLGNSANVGDSNYVNATAIGSNASVNASNSLVLGSIAGINGASNSTNVGVGTTSPSERLEVVGKTKTTNFQMTNGAGANKILQSDASGNASWVNPPSNTDTDSQSLSLSGNNLTISRGNTLDLSPLNANNWKTTGNSGTNAATNFIGTTDSVDLVFKNNNNQNMRLFADGSWLVGDSIQGPGSKTFFDKTKSAFRTGEISVSDARNWDKDSLGIYSFASGAATKAIGYSSTAMGSATNAIGYFSTAMGVGTNAIGDFSTAMGSNTNAIGLLSTAMGGNSTSANGTYSTAMGNATEANGENATSIGNRTKANGYSSLVIGQYNDTLVARQIAETSTTPLFIVGNGSSPSNRRNAMVVRYDGNVAIGNIVPSSKLDVDGKTKTINFQMTAGAGANKILQSDASGNASWVNPPSNADTDSQSLSLSGNNLRISRGNIIDMSPITANTWKTTGNAGTNATSNFIGTTDSVDVVFKNNNNQNMRLFANGNWLVGDSIQGTGNKTFFENTKSAFRTGSVSGTTARNWDKDSIGINSFAAGLNTKAKGANASAIGNGSQANATTSIALGNNAIANGINSVSMGNATVTTGIASIAMGATTTANGLGATSMGQFSVANGTASTAMGTSTIANGARSTAMGISTEANGLNSTSMGDNTKANGYSSLVVGQYNDSLLARQLFITSTTPLFIVGNGTSSSSRSNAMVVRNDGNVAIGNISPTSKLDVDGKTKTIDFQMTNGAGANKILQSDASGNASWVNPTSIVTNDSQSLSLSGTNLSISRGNSIDLSSIFPAEFDPEVASFATNRVPRWNGAALMDGVIQDDANNIGIGTAPVFDQKLTVNGKTTTIDLQMTNGAGVDKILKSDASGNASWFMGAIQDDATNVGIGIAPVFGQKLTVNGLTATTNLQMTSGAGANKILQSDAIGNASWVNFSTIETDPEVSSVAISRIPRWNGTTLMDGVIQDDASDVGIGTAPVSGQKLTVNGQTTTTNLQITSGAGTNRILKSDAFGNASWFLGAIEDDATNVGIGIPPIPGQKLTVNGLTTTTNLQMTNGAGANKILQSDAFGNASWVNYSSLETDPEVSSVATNRVPRWNGTTLMDGVIQDDANNIGIGTAPVFGQKLTIAGKTTSIDFQMTNGAGANKILQSDASGNANWVNPSSIVGIDSQSLSLSGNNLSISRGNTIDISSIITNTWKTTGNTGTNASINFIGTTDSIDLVFKNKNNQNMRLFANGSWLVGDSMQGAGSKTFFDVTKKAFRTGEINGINDKKWNKDSLGIYSFASGFNTIAKGEGATAMGTNTIAYGINSTAIGNNTIAQGDASIAMGVSTEANGFISTAMGNNTEAIGDASTAMGYGTRAIGEHSIATGENTNANGAVSTAMGYYTTANALYSTTMGNNTTASGVNATAMGLNTEAIGNTSTAMGNNTNALGTNTTAMGISTTAIGDASIAMGANTIANGNSSMAMGSSCAANGNVSMAMGTNTRANGVNTSALGSFTIANGYSSLVIGQFNDSLVFPQTASNTATPLFIIGNGTSVSSRTNAMVVRQDGNVAIGNITPTSKLDVDGKTKTINFQMTNGAGPNKILQSDASGNASWVNPSSTFDTDSQSLSLSGNNLSISRGNTLNMSPLTANTWKTTGNSGTNDTFNFVGTTDNNDLVFRTFNNEKLRITTQGYVGIGTNNPSYKMHIKSGSSTSSTFGITANLLLESNDRNIISFAGVTYKEQGITFQDSATCVDNASILYNTLYNPKGISIISNRSCFSATSSTGLVIDSSNLVGINNSNPLRQLHVISGFTRTNVTPANDAQLVLERARDDVYMSIISDTNQESGYQFGNLHHSSDAGIYYNSGGNTYDMRFRVNGNSTKMTIDKDGQVGIGTAIPNSDLETTGSFATAINTTTANITLNENHHTIILTGGTPAVTLPAASNCARRIYVIVNQTGASRSISSYISFTGVASTSIFTASSITLQSDGTNWYRIQ